MLSGSIIKTDSRNYTQWTKGLTLQEFGITYPLVLFSLIETSDEAVAVLAVGNAHYGLNVWGNIYLTKTEPFLPMPSPAHLPTPIPTATSVNNPVLTSPLILYIVFSAILVLAVLLLLYRKHRKITNLNR